MNCNMYWRTALMGFLVLMGLAGGVYTWTWAQFVQAQATQDAAIKDLQAGYNELGLIRSQGNKILENQKLIMDHLIYTR